MKKNKLKYFKKYSIRFHKPEIKKSQPNRISLVRNKLN